MTTNHHNTNIGLKKIQPEGLINAKFNNVIVDRCHNIGKVTD